MWRAAKTAGRQVLHFFAGLRAAAVSQHHLDPPRQHAGGNIGGGLRAHNQLVIRIVERSQRRQVLAQPVVLTLHRDDDRGWR